MKEQKLYFVKFEKFHNMMGYRAIPFPVPFKEHEVERVWTLFDRETADEPTEDKPPQLPYHPVHHQNAFVEDYIHDWNIDHEGNFRYASRVADRNTWILVEMKDPAEVKPKHSRGRK